VIVSWEEEIMTAAAAWSEQRAHEIIAAHAGREGAALPILHALQDCFGCVPEEAVPLVAHALNVTRAEMQGIVTFYHDFRSEPAGRHVLKLCRAEACQSMGGEALAADVQAKLGIAWHETTKDGAVTLEPVYCLGLCALAPSALWDERPRARLDAAKVDALLKSARP
jgi:formate dehydrogenase subunit gamma